MRSGVCSGLQNIRTLSSCPAARILSLLWFISHFSRGAILNLVLQAGLDLLMNLPRGT